MDYQYFRFLCVTVVVMTMGCVVAPERTMPDPTRYNLAERALQELVDSGARAGLVWVVAQNGEILASGAHGHSNKASGGPMAMDSIFRIYSMTRAVTAVAVLQLVEQDRIVLDAPVSRYLPALADLKVFHDVTGEAFSTQDSIRPVTVFDVLTYTAGFAYAPQFPEAVGVDHRGILGLDQSMGQAMTKLASYPLRDQPGVRWRYGYHSDVLGALVETVSGRPLDQYFHEEIFEPLGMSDTGFFVPPEKVDRLVRAYDDQGLDITEGLPPSSGYTRKTTFHSGGGGLVSTAQDWVRFASMLVNDGEFDGVRLLRSNTVRNMRVNKITDEQGPLFWYDGADTGQPGFSPRFVGYGFGYSIGVRLEGDGHTIPGTVGEITWGGLANTNWFGDPKTGLVGLVFAQYLGDDAEEPDRRLREALYGKAD